MRNRKSNNFGKRWTIMSLLFTSHLLSTHSSLSNIIQVIIVALSSTLYGVGLFQDTATAGVQGVSYAGGAQILFSGSTMSHSPADFTVFFQNTDLNMDAPGPALSQDNAFNSYTDAGRLQYTMPAMTTLFSTDRASLQSLDYLGFSMYLLDADSMSGELSKLSCSSWSNCRVAYTRSYTPVLYYLQPPIAYYGSEISFWVDPVSAQNYKTSLELPFTEARIDGQLVDFEGLVDESTSLSGYTKNQVRGIVGKVDPKKSTTASLLFKAGNALQNDNTMTKCTYDNSQCYKIKTLAVINSISTTSGSTTGGQLVTVKGYGFNSKNIDTKIDDASCIVQSYTKESYTCKTGVKATPSSDSLFVGQHGLRRKIYNTTTSLSYELLKTTAYTEKLALQFEATSNLKDGYLGSIFTGYFKAPATANYRFYMSCDDQCQLYLSKVTMDPTQKELILSSTSYSSYRNYFTPDNARVSAWIALTVGEYYYIEGQYLQYSGADHFTVSVEIDAGVSGHMNSMREIQRLTIDPTNTREKTTFTVDLPDGGTYVMNFLNPTTGTYYTTDQINTKATASQFRSVIQYYYNTYFGAPITVELVMYDADGVITTTSSLSKKNVYTVAVNRALASATTNYMSPQQVSTKSKITYTLPKNTQLSSAPLKGNFNIICDQEDGTTNQTIDIKSSDNSYTIKARIVQACPQYRDNIDVWDGPTYNYVDDGRDILIRFTGMNKEIPQFTMVTSQTTPLIGINILTTATTMVPYSSNIFYEPIPFELLYTNEVKPQVIVSVDGIEAACGSLSCDYNYIVPTSSITGYSLSGTTLTISGSSMPTTDIQSVVLSNNPCTVTSKSATQIVCTVDPAPIAGSWQPLVTDSNGLVPFGITTKIDVPLTISSVSPMTGLNSLGDTKITIAGTGFPNSLTGLNTYSITFDDASKCTATSVTSTQIICLTSGFASATTSTIMTVTVNGITATSSSLTVTASINKISAITPIRASPVLKATLKLSITGFTGTLEKTDLSVKIVSTTNSSYFKNLNVIAVSNDNSDKYIQVKYGGAISGTYNIYVNSAANGKFDASSLTFEAVGKVTDYTPKQGSLYGGTIITITGYEFGTDITDNPVKVGSTDCDVISTSANQIKCRTQGRYSGEVGDDELLVFLKASEEAKCIAAGAGAVCQYSWVTDGLPTLTSQSLTFDTTLNDYTLILTGTGFGTDSTAAQLYIDKLQQTAISVSDTQAKYLLTNLKTMTSSTINFYLPVGTPEGIALLSTLTLQPAFISLTPTVGSPAGTYITAVIKGLGVNTASVTLVTSAGVDICSTVKISAYGVVECKTKALTIASNTLKVKVGTTTYSCVGTCTYSTTTTMPAVTSVVLESDKQTITFTGTGFSISGFTGRASFNGVSAATITIVSATSVQAVWTYGVPLVGAATTPELSFKSSTNNDAHWATITSTLTNSNSATVIDSTVQCSFAGGCQLSVTQAGLYSAIQNSENSITVCGKTCTVSATDSSASTVKCALPALATTYSVQNYNVLTLDYIKGTAFSSNSQYTAAAFDGMNQNGFKDSTANCYIGTSFKTGFVGVLREVKYFMNRFTRANFVSKLQFQGSSDGTTYTTLFTVGEEIHEGWNYYSYEQGSELKYRYYRFFGTVAGSCLIGEVSFRGFEVIDDSNSAYSCTATLNLNSVAIPLTGSITYTSAKTPLLTAITPRYGTVKGGELITLTGTNLVATASAYTILIDGIACTNIVATSTTSVQCTTGSRPGLYPNPTLDITLSGYGKVATQGLLFRYCSYWSDETTWGGEFAPVEGESVNIPSGLQLLVDVDSTPILNAVLVEGSLIFPPSSNANHVRTFDAHYVMVKGGYFEAGTEEFPYTSKLIITMHGTRDSPELPIYGNKVIAVRFGHLEMHGVTRSPTWTELTTTAAKGATTITLHTQVDWQVGEQIVIAPTGYYNTETELKTIKSIDNSNINKPIITLDSALEYKHYAGIETYGSETLEMRAEVGLITRNVIYRGDPETSSLNQYGAHIMLHSNGDESLIGRIGYCEFSDVGQAFQLGRYPIHFHLIGTVHNSYVRGNSIHDTYNRAVTIHAVHYLRVQYNVAYKTMGHTFFIEDAVETKNLIEKNLAVLTQRSWSLLNTDQTPASFWITHPDNIFRGNHAAGSDRYGFWFDTKEHSQGPSFDVNVCPENSPLGEFTDNVAHSNGRYGLRIFHKLIPRTNPCSPIVYDATNSADPYWKNPLITATFTNFLGYKNQRNGAIVEQVGDVRFENFKVADNLLAGIEFSLTSETIDGTAQINGALVVGHSINADDETMSGDQHGVITPRTENFQVHNVKFYNFDQNNMAALGSCSHCFHPASTDSGARTITFSTLYFDSTVTKKIRYETPYRDIFYDLDGTLTGKGSKSWATPYWAHNHHEPECEKDLDVYDGLICDSSIQVRRLAIWNWSPNIFALQTMKILKYDDSIVSGMDTTALSTYVNDTEKYAVIPFKPLKDPENGWALPFVTGHKYKLHFAQGLDFTKLQIDLSTRWTTTDSSVYMFFNFTDVREQVDVITAKDTIANKTLLTKAASDWQTGDNVIYNDTATRQIHFVINGKNSSRKSVNLVGWRCVGSCLSALNETAVENTTRRWSDPKSWDSGKVPVAGENVEVKSGWNMIYDVEESPILALLQINGRLTFEFAQNLHLRAKYIFVRAGELLIGNSTQPFLTSAKITLFGEKQNYQIVYDNAIEAGNKIIANTGTVKMYGIKRVTMSRLKRTVYPLESEVLVDPGLSWTAGDKVAFAPTGMKYKESDYAIISAYNNDTGVLKLDRNISFYHYGKDQSTAGDYSGVDMRGEVYLLSRNIIIAGQDVEAWGCQFVTSDFVEITGTLRYGHTVLDNVEIYNCSQYDTYKAALRFEGASGKFSSVTNSVLRHGFGLGIMVVNSANVLIQNNVIFDFVKVGIQIDTSKNITIDANHISRVMPRNLSSIDMLMDVTGGIFGCAWIETDICYDIRIFNNVVSGTSLYGYSVPGHECGDYSNSNFKNNIAHSIEGVGTVIFKNLGSSTQATCLEGSYFSAYKCTVDGAVTYAQTQKAILSNMVFIDNAFGGSVMVGQVGDTLSAQLKNSKFYGETEARDCLTQNHCKKSVNQEGCFERMGLMMAYYSTAGKPPLVKSTTQMPYHKIKSDASYGGTTYYENLQFFNYYNDTTYCGPKQKIFGNNPYGSDYIPKAKFYGTKFTNVAQEAMAYLYKPPEAWANIDDCGNFPCTAPNNSLLFFEKSSFSGSVTPVRVEPSFQIISNNPSNAIGYASCKLESTWNAYYCNNDNLAILLFESLDGDFMKRMITPIYLTNDVLKVSNTLNTFMDHIWDGFYTGQLRMSRWPALIQAGNNVVYNITYSGTPPEKQRFTLLSEYSSVTIRIKYPKAGSYILTDAKGKTYTANAWDNAIQAPAKIKGQYCGENRFQGVVNQLEFYMTYGCTIYIAPVDSIQATIRLNWTLSAFYGDGGSTKFIDRMAASLGIHASTIKVVSVYEGSVIVQFMITQDGTMNLATVNTNLGDQIAKGTINLGAPILGASVGGAPIKIVADTGSAGTTGGTTGGTTTGTGATTTGGTTTDNGQSTGTKTDSTGKGNIVTVTETEGTSEGKSNQIIIIVICLIVVLLIASGIAGFFLYRKCRKPVLNKDSNEVIRSQPVPDKSHESPQEEIYEPQYHPKTDIDIFSRGDPLKKINQADSVIGEDEDSEDGNHHHTHGDDENPNNYTNQSNEGRSGVREDTILTLHNMESKLEADIEYKQKTPLNKSIQRKNTSPMIDI